ncbi:cyclophilin-like fold protein [Saccharopolyspora sp. NPDC050642]|uniref:cyclophilin-like fold protein n=1 Tax=Saccharopolyspora sp. NPDC050642 TaxID=3157099 RepID=UPI0033E0B725
MRIQVTFDGTTLEAGLDDSRTARDFFAKLPLTLTLTDFHRTEKISVLPAELSTVDAPAGTGARAGDLAYYAPWGNLAVFYRDSGYASGLVKLGHIDSGIEAVAEQRDDFTVTIEAAD